MRRLRSCLLGVVVRRTSHEDGRRALGVWSERVRTVNRRDSSPNQSSKEHLGRSDLALADAGLDERGYARRGMLRVAVEASDAASFDAAAKRIRTRAAAVGATVKSVSSDRARELVPPLADVERALSVPDAARVDGRRVTRSLRIAGRERSMDVVEEGVDAVRVEDRRITGVETERDSYDAPNVVIAGGAWSGRFGDRLGVELPVSPERGQIVHLRTDAFDETDEWPIVNAFGELYAVPWPDGRVAIGATREANAGFDTRPTVGGVEEVLSGAIRLLPGVSDAELLEVRVGLRPVSADGRPIIGRVPGVTGAFVATGHGPTGLHLGPYTGLVVSELVRGREPPVDVESFSPARFG